MASNADAGAAPTLSAAIGPSGLARAQWIVGLLMAGSAGLLAVRARLPLPYRDDWDWFRWTLGASSLSAYFVPHNEHVIPLTRLLLQLQYQLEGSVGYTMLAASLLALGLTMWITLGEIARRWPEDPDARRMAGGAALVVLGFAWQLQSIVFASARVFPLVQAFAVASVTCLLNASESTPRGRSRWLALCGLCATAAMLTTTNGLVVPVMLALVAAGCRMSRGVVIGFSALAALAAGLYVAFVWLGDHAAGAPIQQPPSLAVIVGFFLAFYASLVALVTAGGSVVVGALLFAAGLYAVATTWFQRDRPRLEHFAVGVLLFTMASAALAAPTRANFGIVQVAQSRYASFVQPYWAALLLVAASRVSATRRRAWSVPVLAASIATLPVQGVIGAVWAAKADNVAAAGLALRSGGGDEEWMLTLYPNADTPREVSAALVDDGDRSLGLPLPQLQATAVASAGRCAGEARLARVPRGSGLRLHADMDVSEAEAVVVDRAGVTVGVAAPAPVADTPNPSPMDVARAAWRATRRPAPEPPQWMGFASDGAGGPFTLVVLDSAGAPVCRLEANGP